MWCHVSTPTLHTSAHCSSAPPLRHTQAEAERAKLAVEGAHAARADATAARAGLSLLRAQVPSLAAAGDDAAVAWQLQEVAAALQSAREEAAAAVKAQQQLRSRLEEGDTEVLNCAVCSGACVIIAPDMCGRVFCRPTRPRTGSSKPSSCKSSWQFRSKSRLT